MGPPKSRHSNKSYTELLQRNDTFEYRWNETTQSYYLFNPYTGETIFQTDILDRSQSMWAPPDKIVSQVAHTVQIYPEYYISRSWGRRRFNGWNNETDAATHICAVARGFLARRAISDYFHERYYTLLCPFSGYKYFHDNENPSAETSWHKPKLAFPTDIQPCTHNDPEDYMKGEKYSNISINQGPIVARDGIGKSKIKRVTTEAMIKLNPWRDQAVSKPGEIDLDATPLDTIIAWMDGDKAMSLKIDEYTEMRCAAVDNNWDRILKHMLAAPDNILIQLYAFHCFAKSDVQLDYPDEFSDSNIMVDFVSKSGPLLVLVFFTTFIQRKRFLC